MPTITEIGQRSTKTCGKLGCSGHGSKGAIKDGSNGAGPGGDVQGGCTVSAIICQQELGGDWGGFQVPDEVPPLGGATDYMDDR